MLVLVDRRIEFLYLPQDCVVLAIGLEKILRVEFDPQPFGKQLRIQRSVVSDVIVAFDLGQIRFLLKGFERDGSKLVYRKGSNFIFLLECRNIEEVKPVFALIPRKP